MSKLNDKTSNLWDVHWLLRIVKENKIALGIYIYFLWKLIWHSYGLKDFFLKIVVKQFLAAAGDVKINLES